MAKLILDALNPPPPDQLVVDLNTAGADGAAIYVWRPGGIGTWTPAHVSALRAASKTAFPIIVPQPDGGDINGMLGAAQWFGFSGGPITIDAEPPNLPPASWEENFDSAAASNGFSDFDYGTQSDLGIYQPDNQNWVAEWIRTGQLLPLPALPAGRSGWQFVNDITINGHLYDASIIADSVFGGMDMTEVETQMLKDVYFLVASGSYAQNDEAPWPPLSGSGDAWLTIQIKALTAEVQALTAAASKPAVPATVDVPGLVAALEPLLAAELVQHIPPSTDPQTVARAVLSSLATQLDKP